MIELRLRENNDPNGEWLDDDWVEVTPLVELHNIDFERVQVRIDETIYTEDSDEFQRNFHKARLWQYLKK